MKSILDDVREALEKTPRAPLSIRLLNGKHLKVSLYLIRGDGFVVDLDPEGLQFVSTYIPLTAIAHFSVEY